MFINYSHHPSSRWEQAQLDAAAVYGEIVDVPFVNVPPEMTMEEVLLLAIKQTEKIVQYKPSAVLCQGEMTLTYHVVRLLKDHGVKVVCASTKRTAKDMLVNGKWVKQSHFCFVQFREY